MNKKILALSVIIPGLLSQTSQAVSLDDPGLQKKLEKFVAASGIKKDHLSLYAETESGVEVLNINAKKLMIPASISKLVTSAVVLQTFKPDHQFKTQILSLGKIKNGVLIGSLYLKGGGDPGFVSEKMWMLVNDFLRAGIKKVDGDIIADESYLDNEKFDQGRERERNDRAYDAPLSGLSFNWNSTTIYIRPGDEAGDAAKVWADPENEYVTIKNRVKTGGKGSDLSAERELIDGHEVFTVSGHLALGSDEKHIYKNITEPALYAGYNLKSFLKQRGVEVTGKVKMGTTSNDARLESEVLSERLGHLMASQNKFSNNFVAEMLSKDMAAELDGQPGKMAGAIKAAQEFLVKDIGLSEGGFSLVNLSGFTRKNSFSSHQFVQLLRWVDKNFSLSPEFIQSLPVAGVDGTLEKRFKGMAGERKVRAKTGLLNGVVSLAGYAGRSGGEKIIFAFILNGGEDGARVRSIFDGLASQLTQ